eukprot:13681030-Alexandrium_andersonii.AAC.1
MAAFGAARLPLWPPPCPWHAAGPGQAGPGKFGIRQAHAPGARASTPSSGCRRSSEADASGMPDSVMERPAAAERARKHTHARAHVHTC